MARSKVVPYGTQRNQNPRNKLKGTLQKSDSNLNYKTKEIHLQGIKYIVKKGVRRHCALWNLGETSSTDLTI
jgi:hypothetical protein